MSTTLTDIEDRIGETGLTREEVLDFVRLIPSSDILVIRAMLDAWVDELTAAGVDIDDKYLTRIKGDFETYGRLRPETIAGIPSNPTPTLRRKNKIEDNQ